MTIKLNGKEYQTGKARNISGLLDELGLDSSRIVVEHNSRVIPGAQWDTVALEYGDTVEIVSFVGGG